VYKATLPSGRKPTEETGNYETENFVLDKYVNKKWYRDDGQSKRKSKKGSKKPTKDSSSEASSGSESEEEPKPRKETKPRKSEEGKKERTQKPRSKKGTRGSKSERPERSERSEASESSEVTERPREKPTVDTKPTVTPSSQSSGIFGADFDAQFHKLQVSGKEEDAKFGDFTEFQSSQKPTMAKSSDFESFFSDPPPTSSKTSTSTTATLSVDTQTPETHTNNKPAKDAIMALFAQPTSTPRGYGYEMQNAAYPQVYSQYPGYGVSGYPMGVGIPQPHVMYPAGQSYARAPSFGYGNQIPFSMQAAPQQPMANFGNMSLGNRQQPSAAQSNAFEGLF